MRAIRRVSPGRAARPDRRPRQDLLDPGPRLPGRAREPAALAHLRSAVRHGRPRPSLVGHPASTTASTRADLALFLEADAAPDIIGINHYLTSERYLDERLKRYPEHHWGGNGRHRGMPTPKPSACRLTAADLGPPGTPAGSVGALPAAHRRDRGPPWLHAGRAAALADGSLAGGTDVCARKARTSAPSRSGPCSGRSTGARSSRNVRIITSRGPSMCAGPSRARRPSRMRRPPWSGDGHASTIRCSTAPAGGSGTPASTVRPSRARASAAWSALRGNSS